MTDTQLKCFGLMCGCVGYSAWAGVTSFSVGFTCAALIVFMWDMIEDWTQ